MFTGLVETMGVITHIETNLSNISLWIACSFTSALSIDESVSHNGICLTVEEIRDNTYKVTAVQETISITNITTWKIGDKVNLERAMRMNDRLGGHIVQGHVDTTAICIDIAASEGSTNYTFQIDTKFAPLVIEKGSICVNGTSLTCFGIDDTTFTVTIIPYTFTHSTIQFLQLGDEVNIEFDIIGKYILRQKQLSTNHSQS